MKTRRGAPERMGRIETKGNFPLPFASSSHHPLARNLL
jgi:hypothetical protein